MPLFFSCAQRAHVLMGESLWSDEQKSNQAMVKDMDLEKFFDTVCQSKLMELAGSRKRYWRMAKVLNQIFSNKIIAKLGYTSMLDYYLVVMKTKEPLYTELYVLWYGRTVDKIIICLLPDYTGI